MLRSAKNGSKEIRANYTVIGCMSTPKEDGETRWEWHSLASAAGKDGMLGVSVFALDYATGASAGGHTQKPRKQKGRNQQDYAPAPIDVFSVVEDVWM